MDGFRVASYNVLADAYVRPAWFARCAPEHLDPGWRRGAVAEHVAALDADVVCLQEVEDASFAALEARLGPAGYAGRFARKAHPRPDGCATFFRTAAFSERGARVFHYPDGRDGAPDSGHLALILELAPATGPGPEVTVANTHLRWDEPGRPREQRVGLRQATLLLDALVAAGEAVVVCGDLNATPGDEIVREMIRRGLGDAYASRSEDVTCNANARCNRIDFILHGAAFAADPVALPRIEAMTPLPSAAQPSDHLAISARLTSAGAAPPRPGRPLRM